MKISPELADRIYTILVQNVQTPDLEYLRWSFIKSVSDIGVPSYNIDSRFGNGAKLHLNRKVSIEVIPEHQTPYRLELAEKVARMIQEEIGMAKIAEKVSKSWEALLTADIKSIENAAPIAAIEPPDPFSTIFEQAVQEALPDPVYIS